MTTTDRVKLTVALPSQDIDRLAAIADALGTNRTTALIRAVRTLDYLEQAGQRRAKVYVEETDGTRREVATAGETP